MSKLSLYKVDPDYLEYLHRIDYKVSIKNGRPYVGIITMINDIPYLLPLTSQTTQKRLEKGKKKRAATITTFVRDTTGEEIADILHNNMIPVLEGTYTLLDIDPSEDTYESNEIRFIRKHQDSIIVKAQNVYNKRIKNSDSFLRLVCCDFELLENKFRDYPSIRELFHTL